MLLFLGCQHKGIIFLDRFFNCGISELFRVWLSLEFGKCADQLFVQLLCGYLGIRELLLVEYHFFGCETNSLSYSRV